MPKTKKQATSYSAANIQVLEGIAAIRHRPGMYIGSTSTSGLVHLIWEALDNAVDEAVAGYGKHIWVSIDQDGWVTVRDEGRGMPFDLMLYQGDYLPAATVILTVPHSGGKFAEGAYKTAGGLHGVGSTVINALSEKLELTIWKEGQQFSQVFSRGTAMPSHIEPCDPKLHGTQLRWLFDRTIFDPDAYYSLEAIESRLQASAYLNRGVTFHLDAWDDAENQQVTRVFYSREGLPDYVRDLSLSASTPLFKQPIGIAKDKDGVSVEVALQATSGYKIAMYSYANAVRTRDGGVHETGFKAALTKVINDYALKLNIIKNRERDGFKPEVIQQGLNVVISVKLTNPQFQGQTKDRLNNAPVEGIVRSVVDEGLKDWFDKNTSAAKEWLKKIQQMQKARNEAQLVEELARAGTKKNGELIDTSLSKKFLRCNTNDPSRAELFIVEGDSAGGSAGQGRFSEFQAVLKLKGKPLNVAKADLKSIVENEEIRTIINVLGTGTRDLFDINGLKFNRVIIATDADVDDNDQQNVIFYENLLQEATYLCKSNKISQALSLLLDLQFPQIASALRWQLAALRGQCYFTQRQFLKAEQDFNYAVRERPNVDELTVEQQHDLMLLHLHLAGTYRELQMLEESFEQYHMTLHMMNSHTPSGYVAEAHWGLALVTFAQANKPGCSNHKELQSRENTLRLSLEHAENARFLYRTISEHLLAATVICQIARIELALGDKEKARSYLTEILTNWAAVLNQPPATSGEQKRIQQKEANLVSAAACTLAGIELEENHYEQARTWAECALQAGQRSYKLRRADAYLMLARILEYINSKDPLIEEVLRKATEELADTDRIARRINAHAHLGRHLLKIGKEKEGERELEQTRLLLERFSNFIIPELDRE